MALGLSQRKEDIKLEEWTIYPRLATENMSEPMVIMDIPVLVYVFQQTENKSELLAFKVVNNCH